MLAFATFHGFIRGMSVYAFFQVAARRFGRVGWQGHGGNVAVGRATVAHARRSREQAAVTDLGYRAGRKAMD